MHYGCEIEDFVQHSCLKAVCETPIARILLGVCVLIKDIGRRLPLGLRWYAAVYAYKVAGILVLYAKEGKC